MSEAPKVMTLARRIGSSRHERIMPGETMSMGYIDDVKVVILDAPELLAMVNALERIADIEPDDLGMFHDIANSALTQWEKLTK